MAALLLLRTIPFRHHHRLPHHTSLIRFSSLSSLYNDTPPPQGNVTTTNNGGDRVVESNSTVLKNTTGGGGVKFIKWEDSPEYRQWKDREAEILQDIEPIVLRTKEILHSNSSQKSVKLSVLYDHVCHIHDQWKMCLGDSNTARYADGECLSFEDEQAVIERLLTYHPHSEDKIGSGLDSIMVDRHPQFKRSRCLFVIRTDGAWIDFSYQKCLRSYIRDKYPCHAERFIREHFKRGSTGEEAQWRNSIAQWR